MDFKDDQNEPKFFKLSPFSQDIPTTPKWSSGQTNSIGVLERIGLIHIPRKSPTEQCCPPHRLQK